MDKILEKIQQGEGLQIEFKECKTAINKDVYDTVCAFLNRAGGDLFLGVADDGTITGVDNGKVDQMKKDFATVLNNPNRFNPPFYLTMNDYVIDGKTVLHVLVPESSQVHRTKSKIFDRNEDGDLNITDNTDLVARMYLRKQKDYTENQVYPYMAITDLRSDLIELVRKRAVIKRADHPWKTMSDIELLRSAGMYVKDYSTGEEGFTLASVLLFGKDEVIKSVLPYHKVDAILRRDNVDRYDDRDDIRTNLIETYDRLIKFVHKHLPDKFYLDGAVRIGIRDIIFREIITNMLVHREYADAYPTKLVIGEKVLAENASKPHGYGPIDPDNFSPYPKNPVIAGIFKEMGLIDELGSGVRNLYKYSKAYFGSDPELLEGDIFKIIVDSTGIISTGQGTMQATMQGTMQDTMQDEELADRIKEYCKVPRTRSEIQAFLEYKNRDYFRVKILKPLIDDGTLKLTVPDKPRSPNQRYYS